MRQLLRVELTRYRWRRAVLLLLTATVVVPAIIWGSVAWNTRPLSVGEQQRVEKLIEQETQSRFVQRDLKRCVKEPENYGISGADDVQTACESQVLPRAEWFSARSALDLEREREGSPVGVIVVLTMLLLLLGTTFVGHDWHSGSMSNQLLFDPRRLRVWSAKGLVVLVAGFVIALVVLTAYWGGLWLLAQQRGLDVADGALRAGLGQALRGSLLAAFAGLGGYALTMLFRSTVATLGVLFVIALLGPMMIALLGFPGYGRYQPQNNFGAVVLDGIHYYDETDCTTREMDGYCEGRQVLLTDGAGVRYFGGLLLLAVVPSVLSFRRRDVP